MNTVFSHNGIFYELRQVSYPDVSLYEGFYELWSEHGDKEVLDEFTFVTLRKAIEQIEDKRRKTMQEERYELIRAMYSDIERLRQKEEHEKADMAKAAIDRYLYLIGDVSRASE